jgi:hypothetical protein
LMIAVLLVQVMKMKACSSVAKTVNTWIKIIRAIISSFQYRVTHLIYTLPYA